MPPFANTKPSSAGCDAASFAGGFHYCSPLSIDSNRDDLRVRNGSNYLRVACISRSRGYSLLEMVIVVAILMIVASITLEFVQKAAQTMRLRESAINYSNLLQQARLRAVHDDKYYTVLTQSGGVNGNIAFVDIAGSGAYVKGDPMMPFSSGVTPQSFGSGPALTNLEGQFLPNSPGSVQTVNTTAQGPSFGPRGLPCTPTAGGGAGTCPYLSNAGVPTSYIVFFQNTQTLNWVAVTVTPAGRIRQWRYDGSVWSSLN